MNERIASVISKTYHLELNDNQLRLMRVAWMLFESNNKVKPRLMKDAILLRHNLAMLRIEFFNHHRRDI